MLHAAHAPIAHDVHCQFALVGIGASVPPAADRAEWAIDALAQTPSLDLLARSDILQTPAWGGVTAQPFANAVVVLGCSLVPDALLRLLWALEHRAGRVRGHKNGPRTLDLDILALSGMRSEAEHLKLPHPGLKTRDFARVPAAQALTRAPDRARLALEGFLR